MPRQNNDTKRKATAAGIPVYCAHDAIVKTSELKPNPKNPNKHPQEQIEKLGEIIRGNGWRQPITVSTLSGMIVKGHGRLLAAQLEELDEVPVDYQAYESEAAELADLTADNKIAELAEMDDEKLVQIFADIDAGGIDIALTGYTEAERDSLSDALAGAVESEEREDADEDEVIEPPEDPVSKRGDVWILGRHRVMCGDATSEKDRAELFDGAAPQILLTDPPYCSGGSKESDKSTGSIGTMRKDGSQPMIANDILSTRGYQKLIAAALSDIPCLFAYIFTDWRMWVYLFDLAEGAGFGVKSMIVWNKKTPGMGLGWRSQHELLLFGSRGKTHFDGHKGYGNVIEISRSGNELHPTQKPVELIEQVLDNTDFATDVYDPFAGSGTTLIAAENKGQTAYCMELTPGYTDTIVRRYIRATGGADVKCIRNGKELTKREISKIFEQGAAGEEGGGTV